MSEYISVDEALEHILNRIPQTGAERVHVGSAAGRVLAESVDAPYDSPRFDNSAMDGFAVHFDDIESAPTTLPLAGESAAGDPASKPVSEGEAFRISTGAPLPDGADTVVRRELCETEGDEVTVNEAPGRGRGANIRRQGVYLTAGESALEPGTRLGGAEVGLLVSFGASVVHAHRRPRVGIISTGDELVELGESPEDGEIVNSNAYMLEALVAEAGAIPTVFPIAADRRDAVESTYRHAIAACDLVVSTGGVSVGVHDHVRDVVDELTGGMTFWKVQMKPGKPLAFGVADTSERSVPLVGLPGNPASSFVGFQLFVRPALAVGQGIDLSDASLPRLDATLRGSARSRRYRRTYLAGQATEADEGLEFRPRPHQSSGNPGLFTGINALGIIEKGGGQLDDGASISVHLL